MAQGTHCPACNKDIGLWAVIAPSLLSWSQKIRCPHCGIRLDYPGWGVSALCALFFLPVLLGIMLLSFALIPWYEAVQGTIFCGLLIVFFSPPVLVATVIYMRTHKTLIVAKDDAPSAAQKPPEP